MSLECDQRRFAAELDTSSGGPSCGPTGLENPQQSLLPEDPLSDVGQPSLSSQSISHFPEHNIPDLDRFSESGYPPPTAGGQETKKTPENSPDQQRESPTGEPIPDKKRFEPFDLSEDRGSLSRTSWRIVGKSGFRWRRDLSEDGKRLWQWLICEMGDRKFLAIHAAEEGWDLTAALDELRGHGVLDESNPDIVRIISGRI